MRTVTRSQIRSSQITRGLTVTHNDDPVISNAASRRPHNINK